MRSDVRRLAPFVLLALLLAAHLLAADALRASFPRLWRRGWVALALFLGGLLTLALAQRGLVPSGSERPLGLFGASVFGATLGIAGVWALGFPIRAGWRRRDIEGRNPARRTEASSETPQTRDAPALVETPTLSRRELLERVGAAASLAVGAAPAFVGVLHQRTDYELTTVPFRLPEFDRRLDGFTLVQLSDLHFGTYVDDREARVAIDLVSRLRPDAIVLTGDLVDHSVAPLPALGRMIRALADRAPHGVYVILGNHDVWTDADAVLATARRAGATTLVNEHRILGGSGRRGSGFVLGGVDDVWHHETGGPDVRRTFAGADPDLARVLLCHNPEYFPEAAAHVGLQLSGHTHGGQVSVADVDVARLFGYERVAGRYSIGPSSLYVNRGFGTFGIPVRLGARPEITRVVLGHG